MLLFVVAASYLCCQTGNAEAIFRDAVALQAAGKNEQAVERYRQYLKLVPGRVEAISNLGAALARLGRMQEAIEQYRLALDKDPANPSVRLNLALAYYKTAQVPAATKELLVLHKEYPDQLRIIELLADCHLRQGEYGNVIDLLSPVEAAHRDDKGVAYMLGLALLRSNRVPEGERIIDRVFRSGESAEAHLLIGTAKLTVNDPFGARDELARAVELNPKLPGVYSIYGDALRQCEDNAAAQKAYGKALEQDPADFEANLYLGAHMRQEQNFDEALTYLEKALLARPESPAALYQRAATLFGQGKTEEARRKLESLLKDWPTFVEAHVTLAAVYYRLGRRADGDRERDTVRELNAKVQARATGNRAAPAAAGPPAPLKPGKR